MLYSSKIKEFRKSYVLADIFTYILANIIILIVKFEFNYSAINLKAYIEIITLVGIFYVVSLYYVGAYEAEELLERGMMNYFRAIFFSALFFYIISFYIRYVSYSRVYFTMIFPLTYILAVLFRKMLTQVYIKIHGDEVKLPLIAIGFDNAPKDLISKLRKEVGLRIVAETSAMSLADSFAKSFEEIRMGLQTSIKSSEIGIVVYENGGSSFLKNLVAYCEMKYIPFYIVPNASGLLSVPFKIIDNKNFLIFGTQDLLVEGATKRIKRTFDVLLSIVSLILLSCLMLIVWLAVKVTSKGPGIYAHSRYGVNGDIITVYKFRSMFSDSDERLKELLKDEKIKEEYLSNFKIEHDPRVTPLGRFLRRTSMDELPQLFNVLRGDISLVGPRPIIPMELDNYGSHAGIILRVKPGLTGLWQVSGRSDVSYEERIRLDLFYIHNWSLGLDIKIIAQTVPVLLKRRGAM